MINSFSQTFLGKNLEYTNVLDVEDVLRREAVKEVMLREASEYSQGVYDSINSEVLRYSLLFNRFNIFKEPSSVICPDSIKFDIV